MSSHLEALVPPEPGHVPRAAEQRFVLGDISADMYQAIRAALPRRTRVKLTRVGDTLVITCPGPTIPLPRDRDTARILLQGVDWQGYETLLETLDRHHLRITYDRGDLEIMTISPEHEEHKGFWRRVVEILAIELRRPFKYYGSTTNRRETSERGLEPDDSFYFKNWRRMLGKKRLDLTRDPPPDLALEMDVSRSSLDRLSIYANLGVPEVWRYDGKALTIYVLDADGTYQQCEQSPTFPMVDLQKLVPLARLCETKDDGAITRALQAWIRKQLGKKPRR